MLLLDLVDNVALLIAMSVAYDLLGFSSLHRALHQRIMAGIFFGVGAVLVMLEPVELVPGVIHDGRSIVLAIAGFFAGAAGAVPAVLAAGSFRLVLGGVGVFAGLAEVILSAAAGVVLFHLRRRDARWAKVTVLVPLSIAFYLLLLLVESFLIPGSLRREVLLQSAPLHLALFPFAFVLIAKLYLDRERRNEAESMRRTSERLYQGLFENTHAVMLAIRPEDGQILDVSSAAERFYGWSREELTSMKISEINTLSPEEVKVEMERAGTAAKKFFEFRHRRADGSVRDVEVRSGTAIAGDQEVLHSIVFDVTARKRAERERQLMLFGMDRAALGVLRIHAGTGRIERANRKACELLKYNRSELEGLKVWDFDVEMDESVWRSHTEALGHEEPLTVERRYKTIDGMEFPAEVTAATVEYEGERYIFAFFSDITGRKEVERKMRATLKERESLLQEIHHRVKNNLSVISTLISLQVSSAETWEQAFGALQKTRDRINSMGEVHNVLYDAKDLSRLDFSDFVKQRTRGLSYTYRNERAIGLEVRCPYLEADIEVAVPLSLILNELVTNAFKHAFPADWSGSVTVDVSIVGSVLTLVVEDDGVGFPWKEGEEPWNAMGLQLVRLLSEQIDAEVRLLQEAGTRVEVRIPL